jgi:hypothetical protein
MYAHQVIEDLQEKEQIVKEMPTIKNIVDSIKSSSKFHVGNFHGFKDMISNDAAIDALTQVPTIMKMPYESTYIDGDIVWGKEYMLQCFEKMYGRKPENNELYCLETDSRFAYLVQNVTENLLLSYTFLHKQVRAEGCKHWVLIPACTLASVGGKSFGDFDLKAMFGVGCESESERKNILGEIIFSDIDQSLVSHIKNTSQETNGVFAKFLCAFCTFLSCKNIGTETVNPPEKLNKSRLKKGKLPLFSYKTLVIRPTGKKQQSIPKHLWENRVHLCRGHFKTYTNENPLFGKLKGRYWWQPAVRGNKKLGMVHKDYLVETA